MLNLLQIQSLDDIIHAGTFPSQGELYCAKCGDLRRMRVNGLYNCHVNAFAAPRLFSYQCLQCGSMFTAMIYNGAEGETLIVLPSHRGGLTTPHTADGVSYYLDQASKAQSVGANSAAIAMFRGALEQLLFEQGFTKGMLGTKLADLENAIKAGSAPKWAMELDTDFLDVMKELGNGAIHPNDGDIAKQSHLDNDLVEQVKATFHMLLLLVYEFPKQKQDRLNMLKAKVSQMKK